MPIREELHSPVARAAHDTCKEAAVDSYGANRHHELAPSAAGHITSRVRNPDKILQPKDANCAAPFRLWLGHDEYELDAFDSGDKEARDER